MNGFLIIVFLTIFKKGIKMRKLIISAVVIASAIVAIFGTPGASVEDVKNFIASPVYKAQEARFLNN